MHNKDWFIKGLFESNPHLFHKEIKSIKDLLCHMGIDKVIFNENATIVYLTTGEKGVAIRSPEDTFDPIVGFSVAYAIAEGTRGNKRQFHHLVSSMYAKQKPIGILKNTNG